MDKERGIYEDANQAVTEYVNNELARAIIRVEKMRSSDQDICRCPSCVKDAVADANQWLYWFTSDEEVYDAYHYEIVADEKGFRIEQGLQWPKEVFDSDTDTGLCEK